MRSSSRTIALFGTACILFLTACSSATHAELDADDSFDSASYIAAAYITPQLSNLDSSSEGWVLLIDEEGSVATVKTGGIAEGKLLWADTGLVFSDTEHDYTLNSGGLHTTLSPKTDYQHALFPTPDGAVALFNDGFTDDGYIEQVVTFTETDSTLREAQGLYLGAALCDGVMYGIAQPTAEYAKLASEEGITDDGTYGFNALMLTRLSGTPDGSEELVTIKQVPDSEMYQHDAPCNGGVIRTLATAYEDNDTGSEVPFVARVVMQSWDVNTGDFTDVTLVNEAGDRIPLDQEMGDTNQTLSPVSEGDPRFQWVSNSTNQLMTTDSRTGKTVVTADLVTAFEETTTMRTQFTESELFTLTYTHGDSAVLLHSYNRSTGELTRTIEVSDAIEGLKDEEILSGFALPPHLQ